jgi:RND family efflux transporter MFP subunit
MIKKLFLLFSLIFFSCDQKKKELFNEENNIIGSNLNVTVSNNIKEIFYKKILSNGKILTKQKVVLSFNVSNKVKKINTNNGQKVIKGELIASLDNSLLYNNIKKNKIELQKAHNKLTEEEIKYNNLNLTPEILKKLKIKSGVFEAQNSLERSQLEYKQTTLRAPFSGVIANLKKKQGDFISSSEDFCTLIDPNVLEISFSVLENEISYINLGQKVEIRSFTQKNIQFKGVITEINPFVDNNGLIKIKAKIINKNTGLLDGMHVKVFINQPLKDVLVIPKEALVLRSNREVVFTLENGLAKWNYVEIVGENNDSYAIKKGLKSRDTIIISGNLNLSHDAKVNATFVSDNIIQK